MAEITSDVFDIFHPTPVPLKDLSAIVISLEIWRCEINKYRSSNTLKEFRPSGELISLKTILIPDLPSAIYSTIEKYFERFRLSLSNWLSTHHLTLFSLRFDNVNCILKNFEDFVCDYDGTIDYEKTAERLMQCDQIEEHQKFMFACMYCFKDDIVRIWPALGLKRTDSTYVNYSIKSHFQYWCSFLERVSTEVDPAIEGVIFRDFMPCCRRSSEYFWNRIPSENRVRETFRLFKDDLQSFVRYILPKLERLQLDEFLNAKAYELMYGLLRSSYCAEEFVLRTWSVYVKNSMSEVAFVDLFVKILRREAASYCITSGKDCRDIDDFLDLCFEVWISAPKNLRRSVAREIASNEQLLKDTCVDIQLPPPSRELKMLLAILSYATFEERNAFWLNCWPDLINKRRGEDLHKIMKLCFEDEDEIIQFKKNFMADNETVHRFCVSLLCELCFDRMNDFVSFIFPELQAARDFKQQLLQEVFFGYRHDIRKIISKHEEFNQFISDAFNDIDLSKNFKNELVSLPYLQQRLSFDALLVPTEQLNGFIDTFVSVEQIRLQIKSGILDLLKERASDTVYNSKPYFNSVLSWCLGNDDEEVRMFKLMHLLVL
ncbi:uncharacterized protein LOC135848797 [Planococcus citri]|uniref:uncharacterized protein LOC135848797 n=1 Tax=Planococcus citri TaxID=170843 RepID=UPI0031F94BEF